MKPTELAVELELRKLDLEREKARLVLDKSVWLYFLFMIVGVLGFINGYVSALMLSAMIAIAFVILMIGTLPYLSTAHRERETLSRLSEELRK